MFFSANFILYIYKLQFVFLYVLHSPFIRVGMAPTLMTVRGFALHAQKAFDVLLKNGLTKILFCILINFIELTLNTLPRLSAVLIDKKG